MSDYISRHAAIEQAQKNFVHENKWVATEETRLLKNLPSADVVEVVRCKDCKWRDTEPKHNVFLSNGCRWHSDESPDDDDYCSYGERAEE